MVCTFFGHMDTPDGVKEPLKAVLLELITSKGADSFYVGSQGAFDRMVINQLKELRLQYPHIQYTVVLPYLPSGRQGAECGGLENTLYPEGLENVPPKYAIDRRNRWMVDMADYVVTYVKHSVGGAAKFKALAERKGKDIINIAERE